MDIIIIATNGDDSNMFVFRTNGECIDHVCVNDLAVGGVAVDDDGFVYVCSTERLVKLRFVT